MMHGQKNIKLKNTLRSFGPQSVLQQVHSFFQSKFFTE